MKPFSFVHMADIHLGYEQYGLSVRREDFARAFSEAVDKTLELKPDFMIIAGDLFHQARPSNKTLEKAIQDFRRLKEAGIPILAVDGSHDGAPNVITGTILHPLDSAGLIYYLPRYEGACWENDSCYVYGIPNFRTRQRIEQRLPRFYEENEPRPRGDKFSIFVFHMALDIPEIMSDMPPEFADASPEIIPDGFDYYAGGHIHMPWQLPFKGSILVYSGSTETVSYEEAEIDKGFYHVEVNGKGDFEVERVRLEGSRRFKVLERDFTGYSPKRITEEAVELVRENDEPGAIIIPVIKGILPAEASRNEIDLGRIREAAEQALLVRPIISMREESLPPEIVKSIFQDSLKNLRMKALEYFNEFFSERYGGEKAKRIAQLTVDLVQHLVKGNDENVRRLLEGIFDED
ncbi:DNA repair exonuclease [Candidatus Bathyarchaeota archaeon]|nr:DNA repair exonuclease [Candidatus Bathyarchaeota archaeon]